jgi:1-deoxy-D-xylulose-5-phosphate reductoisomerase
MDLEFMSQQQQLVILGATGSIGLSTLDVMARNKALFNVFALTAGHNAKKKWLSCVLSTNRYMRLWPHKALQSNYHRI